MRQPSIRTIVPCFAILLACSAVSAAPDGIEATFANGDRIRVSLLSESVEIRSEAVVPWSFEIEWLGSTPRVGRIGIRLEERPRVLTDLRSRELVLTRGRQRIDLLGPPLSIADGSRLDLKIDWIAADGAAVRLGTLRPSCSGRTRVLAIGFVTTSSQATKYAQAVEAWRLARPSDVSSGAPAIQTEIIRRGPEEVPRRPLGFLMFDLLVVAGDAFRDLEEDQLAALSTWISAGGAAAIIGEGQLSERHRAFVEGLLRGGDRTTKVTVVDEGRLSIHDAVRREFPRWRCGVGRVAVFAPVEEEHPLERESWGDVGNYLWRLPGSSALPTWSRTAPRPDILAEPYLRNLTVGKTRRTPSIPYRALGWLAALYFVLVIFVDVWLFGMIRRRRWTWVWFPSMTVLFAVAIVSVTRAELGDAATVRRWVLIDVADSGRVLRAHCLELSLHSEWRSEERRLVGETIQTIDPRRFLGWGIARGPANPIAPIEFTGNYPFDYRARQTIALWTGVLNVRFWMPGAPEPTWLAEVPTAFRNLDDAQALYEPLDDLQRRGVLPRLDLGSGFYSKPTLDGMMFQVRAALERDVQRIRDLWGAPTLSVEAFGSSGWGNEVQLSADPSERRLFGADPFQMRIASPSGAGNVDDWPLPVEADDLRITVCRELDRTPIWVRRIIRKGVE
ncbi:MAG: hypothetical protein KDC38_16075 [Planctomycetes bacterium]|nr:hypothetical protein [Planctomycetota bacterium]